MVSQVTIDLVTALGAMEMDPPALTLEDLNRCRALPVLLFAVQSRQALEIVIQGFAHGALLSPRTIQYTAGVCQLVELMAALCPPSGEIKMCSH